MKTPGESEPAFDASFALSQCCGDLELLDEILGIFRDAAPSQLAQLRSQVIRQDLPAVAQVAHAIRGSSSNLGADRLVCLTRRIEDDADAGRVDGLEDQVDQIEREIERLCQSMISLPLRIAA